LYGLAIALLVYILYFGHTAMGAQRWINLGFFAFQPSELAKLIIIISLAAMLHNRKIEALLDMLPLLALIGLPFLLIAKQPDLGTALIFIFIFFSMVILANTTSRLIFLLLSPVLSLVIFNIFPQFAHLAWIIYLVMLFAYLAVKKTPLFDTFCFMTVNVVIVWVAPLFWHFLKPYQQERLLVFIDPQIDPYAQGVRYHVDKSITAVGSGGIWGQGWMHGALSHLQYIPVQNSDFIFSVIGEELGLWGGFLIMLLEGTIVYRGIRIATLAKDSFGAMLAAGIAAYFLFQTVINLGMTMGIMPVVGIPLPFVSYGGSALITCLCAAGLLQSINCRREKLFF
ncbi:MAG: FtsW/RodA/SpoVE family cell cycle protein, partial [Candidatus Margulisiibacteriota bacterium]